MSVDYYACEYCGEAIYEEHCHSRSIEDDEICVCDWCIAERLEKGFLLVLSDEDEQYECYSNEIKKKIGYFNAHYILTEKGVEDELERLKKLMDETYARLNTLRQKRKVDKIN